MKRLFTLFFLFLLGYLLLSSPHPAQAEVSMNLYIVPIEQVGSARGPEYFAWRFDQNGPSITSTWSMMDYGFINLGLLYSPDISQTDHDTLVQNNDVYAFDLANLDGQITDKATLDAFFEPLNIPTDWVTPSSTYREFLRNLAGLFQFNQRYAVISGGASFLGNGVTLETRWGQLTTQQRNWFNQTLASFGYQYTVSGNPKLRILAKQAGDLWGETPFILGGVEF